MLNIKMTPFMLRTGRILTLLLAAATQAQTTPLDEAFTLLDQMSTTSLEVSYDEAPLREVLADLNDRSSIPARADWRTLDRLGVTPDAPISLHQRHGSISNLFSAIVLQLGDEFDRPTWEIHAGLVVLTSPEATAPMSLTDIYDIRSLLQDESTLQRLQSEQPALQPPPDPAEKLSDDSPDQLENKESEESESAGFTPLTPGEELMRLISYHIDPDAWVEFGGTNAKISERNGLLFITAPPRTHRRFRHALDRLRQMNPTALSVEARIVDVPRTTVERLSRRYGKSSRRFVLSILREEKTLNIWRADLIVALDQKGEIETTDDETEFRLSLQPHQDAESGLLSLQINAQTKQGADQRQIKTEITLPTPDSIIVLELPPAHPEEDGTLRLLLILPDRH